MSRFEQIAIDTDDPFDTVVDTISKVLGAELLERNHDSSETQAVLARGDYSVIVVDPADLDDSAGMPLSEFRYVLDLWTRPDPRRDGYARQQAAARQVYDRLVASTNWRLLLAFNDLQREIARRDVPAAVTRSA